MAKTVKKGDQIHVTVKLEFTGTVRNHTIWVEDQHIPTSNNGAKNHPIILDGDPLKIFARFAGVKGSTIKTFEVTINNKAGLTYTDLKFKAEIIEIKVPVKYSMFDLIEAREAPDTNAVAEYFEKALGNDTDGALRSAIKEVLSSLEGERNTNEEA